MAKNPVEPTEAPQPDPEEVPDGVFVARTKDEEGNIQVNFEPVGDVQMLEIPSILSIANKVAKARLGVD